MRPKDIKAAVLNERKKDESRLQQSKRLSIPYVTLRRMEVDGYIHQSQILRAAYLAKLGLSEGGGK